VACNCGKKQGLSTSAARRAAAGANPANAPRTRDRVTNRPTRGTLFAVVPPPECEDCTEELYVVLHSARVRAVELGWRVERREK